MSSSESDADRIRRNDKSVTDIIICYDWQSTDAVEILGALKNNIVVKDVTFSDPDYLLLENQEAQLKLSELMKCNKSIESLRIHLESSKRNQVLAILATSGWSSIQELVLHDISRYMSLRVSKDVSNFILKSENLRTLSLDIAGNEYEPIIEALSRTKVQSLQMCFRRPFSLQNGGRQLSTALERCTRITELRLQCPSDNYNVEFLSLFFLESIPLKKVELEIVYYANQQFFDTVGQCIGGYQGEIEELILMYRVSAVNSSIVGLAPALRRLKVIRFGGYASLTTQQIGELSSIVADCDTLEEFGYTLSQRVHTDEFKAICQLLSRFPSLKRVTQEHGDWGIGGTVDLYEESRFLAFLEMIKTSKTIEQVPFSEGRNAEEEAAIQHHCRNNMMHNQIKIIRENGLFSATVPSSTWPLILKKFSDMPDVIYYLLQQKHGAMIGPT